MAHGGDRAFPNLYDVRISKTASININGTSIKANLDSFQHRVERVELDGLKVETDYSEALKQPFLKGVTRIKTVTLSIWETSDLKVFTTFNQWIASYYSFEEQCYLEGIPTGKIDVKVDQQTDLFNPDMYYGISLIDCIPVSVSTPPWAWTERNPYSVRVTFTVADYKVHPTEAERNNPVLRSQSQLLSVANP